MQGSILAKRVWPALAAGCCVAYLYGLGVMPFAGADEPRYAEVAREMFARRDLVTPTLGGLHWFEKPALLYWLMAGGYAAFGVTEFAARLSAACAGLLTVLSVWALARRVESASEGEGTRGLGVVCAAVLASSAGLLVFSRGVNFDVPLTAAVTAALSCFLAAEIEAEGRRRTLLLAGFYASLGLALLSKGLVGLALPGGIVLLYYALAGRRPRLARLGVWWGTLITLAVAAVWYGPVIERHGREFVSEFFVQHHLARFVSNKYHHPQPFYFYVPVMLMLALPWTPFLVGSLAGIRRWRRRSAEPADRLRLFALAWLVVPVAFFSLSGSKLPGYVLPALPAAALLSGHSLQRFLRGDGPLRLMRVTGALVLAFGVGGLIFMLQSRMAPAPAAVAVAAPSLLAGACATFFARRRTLSTASVVAAAFLTVPLIAGTAVGDFARRESVRDVMNEADARGLGGLPVLQMHTTERSSEFYAAGRLVYTAEGQPRKFEGAGEVLDFIRRAGGQALVIVPVKYANQLTQEPGAVTEIVGDNGHKALVYVKANQ